MGFTPKSEIRFISSEDSRFSESSWPWAGTSGAAIFVLMNLSQYFRIRREERVLSEAFGDEYRAYKASTWF